MPDPRVYRTTDGRWRVYLYPDHTAELCDEQGVLVVGRSPLHRVMDRLVAEGYTEPEDLVPE